MIRSLAVLAALRALAKLVALLPVPILSLPPPLAKAILLFPLSFPLFAVVLPRRASPSPFLFIT